MRTPVDAKELDCMYCMLTVTVTAATQTVICGECTATGALHAPDQERKARQHDDARARRHAAAHKAVETRRRKESQ